MSVKDLAFLSRAVELAEKYSEKGDCGPFGAVIVKDNEVISEGWNQVVLNHDPTQHAEVVAIRQACEKLDSHILSGCTLYSSCEPCPMCFGASIWARVERIVYAETREGAQKAGFDDQLIYDALQNNSRERIVCMEHLPLKSASDLFINWLNNSNRIQY